MNILPKKRWHVRTKENIARVRKDEAEAAEKERLEQQRIENADREARLNVLKLKSKQKLIESGIQDAVLADSEQLQSEHNVHINLFSDLEHAIQTTNKDHDREVKEKKEEYEKKIGYLTYLGQDTNEALKKKNWYDTLPEESRFSRSNNIKDTYDKLVLKDADGKPKVKELDIKDGEVSWKSKQHLDPMNAFRKYCTGIKIAKQDSKNDKPKHKHKKEYIVTKHKNKKQKYDEKKLKLQKLREARLKREQQEKFRTEKFLADLNGNTSAREEKAAPKIKPKYNSQFNPELARQNFTQ